MVRLASTLALLALASPFAAHAADTDPPPVRAEFDLRLRHEGVDDDAFSRDAEATTLRLRAGLRFALGHGWSALVEGEGIANANDHYNSGANGATTYPAVLDAEGAELNQAWLAWKGEQLRATAGRQRIALDNQRWVGNVGWRQNEQTFDALEVQFTPAKAWTLRYAWLDKVHRVSGDDAIDPLARERDLSTHLFNVSRTGTHHTLGGYAYLHEDLDVPNASTATYGLRWTTRRTLASTTLGLALEVARQRDHADNALSFTHTYWLVEPSLAFNPVTITIGWEHLGGNGTHALQTPLATLHAFNGWADRFLTTPPQGLEDRYVTFTGKQGAWTWTAAWHDFRPDHPAPGVALFGRELDLSLARSLGHGWSALVKAADFRGDSPMRDSRKVWLQLQWTH